MFATVALFSPPFASLTYSLPDYFPLSFWQPGLRVFVPVGNSLRTSVILATSPTADLPPRVRCKDIGWPMETKPVINATLLRLAQDLALRSALTPGAVFGNILPTGLRSPRLKILHHDLTGKKQYDGNAICKLSKVEKKALAQAIIDGSAILAPPTRDLAELELCSINTDPPWPIRPAAKKQAEILDYLHSKGSVSRRRLLRDLGPASAVPLQKLLSLNLVKVELAETDCGELPALLPPPEPAFKLNNDQQAALDDLASALCAATPQTRLLHGVTGSGKTAVYLELARKALQKGKSVLLLAPEVALAYKLYRDVCKALPDSRAILYHGYQHPSQRESNFRRIADQIQPVMVVGTRSALFLPLPRPGLIILDEEHDGSYKQDEKLCYHAKEVSWFLMQETGGLLVLGSATPDIRAYHASQSGRLPILTLPTRAAGAELPPLELVHIGKSAGKGPDSETASLLAPDSERALAECADRGEQAVILLNRRGYAPLVFCVTCQETVQCPNCQIGMSYHKGLGKLLCHYCDYSIPWPGPCPKCGDNNFIPMGEGTERIAERLAVLAGQPVLRLDRDSTRRPGKIDEILTAFGEGKSPFLVGTQMLSKGHHFPNVTLVVVADGDIGLNLPDYRASERTFQLLLQAAGRAGRGAKKGRAIIQTRKLDHYCWTHLLNYDYAGFYESELALRKKYHYPPFVCLGLLRISFAVDDEKGPPALLDLAATLKQAAPKLGLLLLGPAPSAIGMQNGRKRFQCLMKGKSWEPMRKIWFIAQKHAASKILRLFLDLDPVNMM